MKFTAQIKRVQRLARVSNDTEYTVTLVTEQPLTELMEIKADELVEVEIKKGENKW